MTEAATQETTRTRNEPEPRRRRAEGEQSLQKMTAPAGAMDTAKFDYRWANDDGARLHQLTVTDDWDFVTKTGSAGTAEGDDTVKHRVGAKADNSPLYAYLIRKPKKYADADRAKKLEAIDRDEKARLREVPGDAAEQGYKPKA